MVRSGNQWQLLNILCIILTQLRNSYWMRSCWNVEDSLIILVCAYNDDRFFKRLRYQQCPQIHCFPFIYSSSQILLLDEELLKRWRLIDNSDLCLRWWKVDFVICVINSVGKCFPFIHLSSQILLPRYLMNALNNFDETDSEYSLAFTDDLIRF